MIEKLPGWLNFFLLGFFYCAVFIGLYEFFTWLYSLDRAYFLIGLMGFAYAGAYLAKFREQQGGGWRFW